MKIIQYAGLKYYNSCVSDECLYIGMLFNDITTNTRIFKSIKNFRRLQSFDDEISIDFFKAYLKSIKEEVECSIFNFKEKFNMEEYVKYYTNEIRFSDIKTVETDDDSFIENTCKIFLKFDYEKKDRLNKDTEKKYIKQILKSKNISFTTNPVAGKYNELINFDVATDEYGIKFFSFENKELNRLITNAKAWSYSAEELKGSIKSIFLYDLDFTESKEFNAIINILKKNADAVMPISNGIEFISNLS